jgi:hypothetical protein
MATQRAAKKAMKATKKAVAKAAPAADKPDAADPFHGKKAAPFGKKAAKKVASKRQRARGY